MNCRRINSLLSAYLDSELTGMEMLAIREHLDECSACTREYETLQETKRLVASLAFRAPRAELEALLMREAEKAEASNGLGAAASRLLGWLGWGSVEGPVGVPLYLRPRPIAATALLSLAGFWLASASLDLPGSDASGAPSAGVVEFDQPTTAMSAMVPPPVMVASLPSASGWGGQNAPYATAASFGGGGLAPVNLPTAMSVALPSPTAPSVPPAAVAGWSSASLSGGGNPAMLLMAARRMATAH